MRRQRTPTELVARVRKSEFNYETKRWLKSKTTTLGYIRQESPSICVIIPISLIEIISIFHHESRWLFSPKINEKYPDISVSNTDDDQAAHDLTGKSGYKAINFGPIMTYGTYYRCIFLIDAALGWVTKLCIVPGDYDITQKVREPKWVGSTSKGFWNDSGRIEATDQAFILKSGERTINACGPYARLPLFFSGCVRCTRPHVRNTLLHAQEEHTANGD